MYSLNVKGKPTNCVKKAVSLGVSVYFLNDSRLSISLRVRVS